MDEPTSALDPISTSKIEDLVHELKKDYTIVIVTHNMQQAARVSDKTGYFYLGELIEYGETRKIFTNPEKESTQNYITGQLIVELVILPNSPIVLKYQGENNDILEIPTVLSPIKEISQDLSKVQVSALVANFNGVLTKLNQELPNILPQVSKTFQGTSDLVATNAQAIKATIKNLNDAAVSVKRAGDSLRNLTDYLERHPESIVRGKEK